MKILKQKQYWLDHFRDPKYEEIREKILNAFGDLKFYEGPHEYYLGEEKLECVSNVTHMFKHPYDVIGHSERKSRECFNNPNSEYYHKTPEEIRIMWEENSKRACNIGTERHAFAESCFYFMTGQYDKILPEFKDRMVTEEDGTLGFEGREPKEIAVVHVYEDFPDYMIPILAETQVFNKETAYWYAGTFDILFYLENPDTKGPSGLYVLDWKTNKNLYNWFGEYLQYPFDSLKQMDVSMYKLQLALYQLALENLGLKVLRRELFWLKPDASYEKVKLENLTKEITEGLKMKKMAENSVYLM